MAYYSNGHLVDFTFNCENEEQAECLFLEKQWQKCDLSNAKYNRNQIVSYVIGQASSAGT